MGGSTSSGTGTTIGARTASAFGRLRNRSGGFRTVTERARANYQRAGRRRAKPANR